jgi:hypothetical protein
MVISRTTSDHPRSIGLGRWALASAIRDEMPTTIEIVGQVVPVGV